MLGGYCAYLDVESALDLSLVESMGVNTKNLLISNPDCSENLLSLIDTLTKSGAVDVIVVDSVASLVPKRELDQLGVATNQELHSQIMTQALRKMYYSLSRSQTLLVFVNQVRFSPKAFAGRGPMEEVTFGGNVFEILCSCSFATFTNGIEVSDLACEDGLIIMKDEENYFIEG